MWYFCKWSRLIRWRLPCCMPVRDPRLPDFLFHSNISYFRSSYSFTQASDIEGSPFTATSFKDCLLQCDNNAYCNYMSFDSSIFKGNCAIFERGGVSSDILRINPLIDSAKALVAQTGGVTGGLSPDPSLCPTYDSASGTCSAGTLAPWHHNTPPSRVYTYTANCHSQYTASKASSITSTLTVNTFLQCLDACDVGPNSLIYQSVCWYFLEKQLL